MIARVKQGAIALLLLLLTTCNQIKEPIVVPTKEYHNTIDRVTNIMVHDIFSPPVVLINIIRENFSLDDNTELKYGIPTRTFKSFALAGDEAAIRRMYGSIHYRAAIEIGVKQGRGLGEFVVDNLRMK